MAGIPAIRHKSLTAPRENVERMEGDLVNAGAAVARAEEALRERKDADLQALADAKRLQRPEPKPSTKAATEKLEAARLNVSATEKGLADAKDDLEKAREANKPGIVAQIDRALEQNQAEEAILCDELQRRNVVGSELLGQRVWAH